MPTRKVVYTFTEEEEALLARLEELTEELYAVTRPLEEERKELFIKGRESGITCEDLGKVAGMSASQVSRLARGISRGDRA